MNEWTWEGNEQDKTGYAVNGFVRIKMVFSGEASISEVSFAVNVLKELK